VTSESQRLLVLAVRAINGRSWGPRFRRIVDAIEEVSPELWDLLTAAADFGDDTGRRAWLELAEALEPGDRFVLLDLAVEVGRRAVEDVEVVR
jgi:hypothetical protein